MKKIKCAAAFLCCAALLAGCSGQNAPTENDVGQVTQASEETAASTEAQTENTVESSAESQVDEDSAEAMSEAPVEEKVNVSCTQIVNDILGQIEMSSMAEVGLDRIPLYLDCEIPEGTDFSMYICGSGGFADEVFVIYCGDSYDAYEAAAGKRIESRKKDFEGYNPDEYDKLDGYYSEYSNGYFIYAVTPDNSKCEEIFGTYTK